jgi:hypothetical protein
VVSERFFNIEMLGNDATSPRHRNAPMSKHSTLMIDRFIRASNIFPGTAGLLDF